MRKKKEKRKKIYYLLKKNNNISLSKRTKSGDKDKYQTIMNNKMQNNHNYNHKYMSYFQSPKKGEDLLFIKKKFQKMRKNTGEKTKKRRKVKI